MPTKLFISREGKTLGPFPEEKVKELYEKGKLEPEIELWAEGAFAQKTTVGAYFGSKGKSGIKGKTLYVSIDGKVKGPFPESKIRALLDAGEIRAEDHVCETEGNAKWVEAGEYFGIESRTESADDDDDTYVGDEDDVPPRNRADEEESTEDRRGNPLKIKKSKKKLAATEDFGTPDVVFILKNLNDGTFLKNFTGVLVMVLGLVVALYLLYFIGDSLYRTFSVSMPAFIIIARIFLVTALVYPIYFLAVSSINSGLRIRSIRTSQFITAPIAAVIMETLANNCLIFGLFLTLPITAVLTAANSIFLDGMDAIAEGGKCFATCVLVTVGAFFLAKFSREFLMVFFVIREDLGAIREVAEEKK